MLGKDRAVEHVESQRNSCGVKQLADHGEIVAGIGAAVAESAAGDHVINLRQLRQREIGPAEISVRSAAIPGFRFVNELGHVVDADVGKGPAMLVQERLEITVTAAGIEHGASGEVAQPQQRLEALALAFRAPPAKRFNASRLELMDAVPVIM